MSEEIKKLVQEKYTEVVTKNTSCCSTDCCDTGWDGNFSDSYEKMEGYEADADLSLGCGIPTEHAQIKEGHTVLDLGSGAGNDVFVARSIVGDQGAVWGIDFTPAMIEKANVNKAKLGFENVHFVQGDIEEMPIESDSMDVVISNCVMNLVPNKLKAYQQVHRVLKDTGHFSISDVVIKGEIPEAIQRNAEMYVGCVAGAMPIDDYVNVVKEAGFNDPQVLSQKTIHLPDEAFKDILNQEEIQAFRDSGGEVLSITLFAKK